VWTGRKVDDVISRVHNLTFHGVGDPGRTLEPGEAAVWIGTDALLTSLDAVRDRQDVRITFDDGNRSDVDIALPPLLERGLTATFFVLAGRLGDPDYLDDDDIRRLVQSGMSVGSHGMDHVNWRTLDSTALRRELVDARVILERITGREVTEASVPFGSYDRRVLSAARSIGCFRRVYTSDGGEASRGSWLQARNTVHGSNPRAALAAAGPLAELTYSVKRLAKRWR
jgi:peptidoglycan/xylan/chitin deacetylase (PgdA/CDA1 family)